MTTDKEEHVEFRILSRPEIAKRVGVTRQAVSVWTHRIDFPKPVALDRWDWDEVREWLETHRGKGQP